MMGSVQTSRARHFLYGSLVSLFVIPLIFSVPWRTTLPNALQGFVISAQALIVALAWRVWIKKDCREGCNIRWYPETEGALLLFLILSAASAWVTSGGLRAVGWLSAYGSGLLLFMVIPALASTPEGLRRMAGWISTGGALLAVVEMVVWQRIWGLPGVPALPSWLNPNYAAQLLLLPWFVTLHELLSRPVEQRFVAVALRFALISTAVMMSRSRALWLGIAVALVVGFVGNSLGGWAFARPWLRRRTVLAVGLVLASVVGVSVFARQAGLPTPADTFASLLQPAEGSAGGRLRRWENALPMIGDHLWFGVGPGRWLDIFPRYRNGIVPESDRTSLPLNTHLEVVGENGLLAFLAACVFIGSLLRRRPGEPPEESALRLALVSWLVAASFHNTLRLRILLIGFWLNLALIAATRPPTHKMSHSRALQIATAVCVALALGLAVEARVLSAALHDHVATAYVRYAGDEPQLEPSPMLRWARPWFTWVFSAAFYRERGEELRAITRWATGKPDHLFMRIAEREQRDGRCESALQWLTWAEQETTASPETHYRRCVCEARLGRLPAAGEQCAAGLALNHRDPQLQLALGDVQAELNEPIAALQAYGRARRLLREHLSVTFGASSLRVAQSLYSDLDRAGSQDLSIRRTYAIDRSPDELLETIAWTPQAHKSVAVDQSAVYFSTNASGRYAVWRLPLTGDQAARTPELLTNDQRAPFRLRRHPTRPRLYFVADSRGDYEYHVYALDLTGNAVRRLTSGGREGEYEISPDGQWLAFKRERGMLQQLCISDADGRNERCGAARSVEKRDLAWYPDSEGLVFVEDDDRLVEVQLDPQQERTLLELSGRELRSPSLGPAGDRLALVVREPGSLSSIEELTLATGERRPLTPRVGEYLSPIWLDAHRLLFRESVNDHYLLRTLTTDDGRMTSLGAADSVIFPVELSADRRDAVFFRSDETTPIVLERLSLVDGHSEELLRIDSIQAPEVVSAQRWSVSIAERELPAYLYVPRGTAPERGWPCVIWLHGSSSSFSPRWHPYAQYFAHAGFAFVALNFSGSPGLPWLESNPVALQERQVEEARQLRRLLAQRSDIDSGRVFLIGVSVGTRILQDVLRSDPRAYAGAVEYSPITSRLWQTAQSDLPPLLIFLADNDPYLDLSERLAQIGRQRRQGTRVEVVRFHDEGHDIRALSAVASQLVDTVRFLRSIDRVSATQ